MKSHDSQIKTAIDLFATNQNQYAMKKIISILSAIAVMLIITTTSCGNSKSTDNTTATDVKVDAKLLQKFQKDVDRLNSTLPLDMGNGVTLVKTEITDGQMVNIYNTTTLVPYSDAQKAQADILQSLGKSAEILKKCGLGIEYIYRLDADTTKFVRFTIPVDSL